MLKDTLSLGMFTVRNEVQQDMKAAFMRLSEMGYRGIEFYGEQNFDIPAVQAAFAASGLRMTSWHVEWRNLQADRFDGTVDYLKRIGCSTAIIPCLGGKWNIAHTPAQERREIWLDHIKWLCKIDEKLRACGIRTGYHNHEHEFLLKYDGKCVFDMLFENLPADMILEFDTGNCIEGGYDPVQILQKYRARDIFLHLKPYSRTRGFNTVLGAPDDLNDWRAIFAASPSSIREVIIESENEILGAYENAQLCINGLRPYLTE